MDGVISQRFQIVGLVRDTKYEELREDFTPIVYLAQAQDEEPRPWTSIVVRSDLPLSSLRASLTSAIGRVSPEIDILYRSGPSATSCATASCASASWRACRPSSVFLAAILAMIGLYGVVSYMVVRRRNEIGVRIALGASRRDILVLVLREAGTLLAIGLAIGIVLAIGAATFARSLLFGLQPSDPATIAIAAVGLAAVAAAASLLPAHRAATLDPVAALREE